MKKHIVLKVALILLAAVVLTIGGYLLYAVTAYHRLPDNMELDIVSDTGETARSDSEYTLVSWNIGFGAYTDDYTFFMDGGKSSRAASRESVIKNVSIWLIASSHTVRTLCLYRRSIATLRVHIM